MKRFCLASAMVFAAALLAPPAAAADYYALRHYGPRHHAQPHHAQPHHAQPHHAYPHHAHARRGWTCNAHRNCEPNWGWGKDVATRPVATVIVARGEIPLFEPGDRYTNCQAPRRIWTGFRWLKAWDQNC